MQTLKKSNTVLKSVMLTPFEISMINEQLVDATQVWSYISDPKVMREEINRIKYYLEMYDSCGITFTKNEFQIVMTRKMQLEAMLKRIILEKNAIHT